MLIPEVRQAASFKFDDGELPCAFSHALHGMRSLLVHGVSDERVGLDCLYLMFSSHDNLNDTLLSALDNLLPYLDTALRRIRLLDCEHDAGPQIADKPHSESYGLTKRELQILHWVRIGKTNADTASILGISNYTVKNHMQNIFKKLDVYNRMQAISKFGSTSETSENDPASSLSPLSTPQHEMLLSIGTER